jgi:hypothetical protein
MGSRNPKCQRIHDTLTPVWMKYFLLKSPGSKCFLEKKMLRFNTLSSKPPLIFIYLFFLVYLMNLVSGK